MKRRKIDTKVSEKKPTKTTTRKKNEEQKKIKETNKMVWFGFFLLWHINFRGLFNTKALLVEDW